MRKSFKTPSQGIYKTSTLHLICIRMPSRQMQTASLSNTLLLTQLMKKSICLRVRLLWNYLECEHKVSSQLVAFSSNTLLLTQLMKKCICLRVKLLWNELKCEHQVSLQPVVFSSNTLLLTQLTKEKNFPHKLLAS